MITLHEVSLITNSFYPKTDMLKSIMNLATKTVSLNKLVGT